MIYCFDVKSFCSINYYLFTPKKTKKMINLNNLFVKGQHAAQKAAALTLVLTTILVAIAALYGLGFSVTWIAMLLENPAALHAPATFNSNELLASVLAYQPVETMAFWTLPIKLQGLIIVFLGAACFYIASYAGEWLSIVVKLYPFTLTRGGNITNGIALRSKWQPLIDTVRIMWNNVISTLRKVALYIMFSMATIAIVYFVWNILAAKCPM